MSTTAMQEGNNNNSLQKSWMEIPSGDKEQPHNEVVIGNDTFTSKVAAYFKRTKETWNQGCGKHSLCNVGIFSFKLVGYSMVDFFQALWNLIQLFIGKMKNFKK